MVTEVPLARIGAYTAYFPGPHAELVVASIAAGNTAAQLWQADQPDGSAAILLWDKGNNVFYLAGQLGSEATRRDLAQLIATDIRPSASAEGLTYFKVRALSPSTEGVLEPLFDGVALRQLRTWFYHFRNERPRTVPTPMVEDIRFMPIDRTFLARADLANIEPVREEIRWMWSTEERFDAHGFGYAAVTRERVICWCTAEYVSAGRCGIGIATEQAYERRGVATATAAQFVRYCQQRGIAPYWECQSDNIGSTRVAEKVGFERIAEEVYWAGAFGK
jgi:RimJ/RimL family protein N-acetyltransferase